MTPRQWMMEIYFQGRILMRRLRPGTRDESLRDLFLVVNQFLSELEVEYWLAWGTLLGHHRERGILAHDTDIDFGALARDYPRILAAAGQLPPGFRLLDTSHKHHGPKLFVDHRGWCADIYFHEERGEELHPTLRSRLEAETAPFPAAQVLPTREATFLGAPTRVPAQEEEHLLHCFRYLGTGAHQDPRSGYWHPST